MGTSKPLSEDELLSAFVLSIVLISGQSNGIPFLFRFLVVITGLKERISNMQYAEDETESFISFWNTPMFKKEFLSAKVLTLLHNDRKKLPKNPRELLYALTKELSEYVHESKIRRSGHMPYPIPEMP